MSTTTRPRATNVEVSEAWAVRMKDSRKLAGRYYFCNQGGGCNPSHEGNRVSLFISRAEARLAALDCIYCLNEPVRVRVIVQEVGN